MTYDEVDITIYKLKKLIFTKIVKMTITFLSKNLSSQCNLPPQIEPVQDKIAYYTCSFLSIMFLVAALCSLAI